MTMKTISKFSILALVAITFTACFEFDEPQPREPFTVDPAKVMTIRDFKALHQGWPITFHPDSATIFISGQVISNDQDGNIFREFFIQDSTGGLRIKDGRRGGLNNFFKLGQTVYVFCNGLTLGNNRGTLELGTRGRGNFEVDFIEAQWLINHHIFQGDTGAPVPPKEVKLSELNPGLIGSLVRINDLTFVGGSIPTWANLSGDSPQSLSQIFSDTINPNNGMPVSVDGRRIIVRTSGFARFAGETIPTYAVDIVGILTRFDGNFQLVLRDLDDVTPSSP